MHDRRSFTITFFVKIQKIPSNFVGIITMANSSNLNEILINEKNLAFK